MRRRTLLGLGAAVFTTGAWTGTTLPGAATALSTRDTTLATALSTDALSTDAVSAGEFTKIYDQSVGESGPWYINDHTFVRAADGTWHMFGITHAEPADPVNEDNFAHATAPELHGSWTKQPFALTVDPDYYGETYLWAPHVVEVDGTYHMFYCGGGTDDTQTAINTATSTDLFTWTRRPEGPIFRDGFNARDPYVIRIGDQWVIYYKANSEPTGGNHTVAYRTSTDLVTWSDRQTAYTDPTTGDCCGVTESPFVHNHNGRWYLFIGPRPSQEAYIGTDVFVSDDPFHFDVADQCGHIASHAAEVISDGGADYVSSAGWGQGGLYLAPLNWAG